MSYVDDSLDLLIGVVAAVFLLWACAWAVGAMRNSSAAAVQEISAVHNVYGQAAEEPVLTGKDMLLSAVVSDAYMPSPSTVIFQDADDHTSYTVVYNAAFFSDKEASLTKIWSEFFYTRMDKVVTSMVVDPQLGYWTVVLAS